MRQYIRNQGYKFATLVAFSGEITDAESGPDPFTETSKSLNPNLRGREIREAFNTDEYQILLVANKFQTGFDQPLLCGMYVDKRLAGITAVQTLSRLNRAYPGKDTTYVVDFVNDPQEILIAFKTYYETAELSGCLVVGSRHVPQYPAARFRREEVCTAVMLSTHTAKRQSVWKR